MDEKARGEAVAESTKRLGEESSLLRSKKDPPVPQADSWGRLSPQKMLYIPAEICYNKLETDMRRESYANVRPFHI